MTAAIAALVAGCGGTDTGPQTPGATPPACDTDQVDDGGTCVPAACGVGPWGDLQGDVWVRAGAAEGGDGTVDRPLPTLQEGADAAAARGGGTVAIAAGTYTGALTLDAGHDGVVLAGRCSALVYLDATGSRDDFYPAVAVEAGRNTSVTLSGMEIGDAPWAAIGVLQGALTLTDVAVTRAAYAGIYVQGERAAVTADHVWLADTQPIDGYASGFGIETRAGAVFEGSDVHIERSTAAGLNVHEGSELTLDGYVLAEVYPEPGARGGFGRGALVTDASHLTLQHGEITDTVGFGVVADDSGSQAVVTDLRLARILPGPDGLGVGLAAGVGARIDGAEVTVESVEGSALWAVGGTIDLDGVSITAITGSGKETPGVGGFAGDGGEIVLTDASIADCVGAGLWASVGGSIRATRTSITAIGLGGERESHAALATEGGAVTLTDTTIEAGPYSPVVSADEGSRIELTRVTVSAPVAPADGAAVCVAAERGGTLIATDLTVTSAWVAGVQVNDGTLVVDGVDIAGVQPIDGEYGYGLSLVSGAQVTGSRVTIADVQTVGVSATQSFLDLDALTVTDVHGDADARGVDLEDNETILTDLRVTGLLGYGVVMTGGTLAVDGATLEDLGRPSTTTAAVGLALQVDALADIARMTVSGVEGPGVSVYGSELTCADCVLGDNRFAGLVVLDATARLLGGTLDGNLPDASLGGGVGALVLAVRAPATLTLDGTAIGPHTYAALWADGATVDADDVDLSGGPGLDLGLDAPVQGNAMYATNLATVAMRGGALHDASIAALLNDATGTFDGVAWDANAVDIQQQGCANAAGVTAGSAPRMVICPPYDTLTLPLTYYLNLVDPVATAP